MKTKRKRKEGQVNYNIRKYAEDYWIANLVVGRTHPDFEDPIKFRNSFRVEYPWLLESYRGNQNSMMINTKKKFRNLNYRIFVISYRGWRIKITEKEVKERVLQARWKLIENYIKHK